ncbi:unnamed protein product, partial [Cuscuta campestris]
MIEEDLRVLIYSGLIDKYSVKPTQNSAFSSVAHPCESVSLKARVQKATCENAIREVFHAFEARRNITLMLSEGSDSIKVPSHYPWLIHWIVISDRFPEMQSFVSGVFPINRADIDRRVIGRICEKAGSDLVTFLDLRQFREQGLNVTPDEIFVSTVTKHDAKNRVHGVGDLAQSLPRMHASSFGEGSGEEGVGVYEIRRGSSFSVKITNYGATVISVTLPDKHGKVEDVVLGFDSVEDYKNDTTYFGAIVGRVANRIGGARFKLNGTVYKLPNNDHGNTLHGGTRGFSDVIWTVEDYKKDSHLTLSYHSYDGEQGFPGELDVKLTYMFIGENKLGVRMKAKAVNKATPVNLASHTYWNLRGHDSGNILSHKIQIFGSKITPVNEELIPTGAIESVKGTPYDFQQPQAIGTRLDELPGGYDINYVLDDAGSTNLGMAAVLELLGELPGGYDINYVFDSRVLRSLSMAAVVEEGKSGRKMEMWTNMPGVQFYTSNSLKDTKGKGGFVYKKHAALCLETQGFPDAVNHPNFPSQIVNPGETDGRVLVETAKVAKHWGEYFCELLNAGGEQRLVLDELGQSGASRVYCRRICLEEVVRALRGMRSGRALGPDEIPVEFWKHAGRGAWVWLTKLFNVIFRTARMPDEWRE